MYTIYIDIKKELSTHWQRNGDSSRYKEKT